MESAKEKIEVWKGIAEIFLKNNTKAYLKEINGNYHFCYVLLVGEETILVENFGPKQRAGTKDKIYWYLISDFNEYNGEEK